MEEDKRKMQVPTLYGVPYEVLISESGNCTEYGVRYGVLGGVYRNRHATSHLPPPFTEYPRKGIYLPISRRHHERIRQQQE